MRTTYLTHLLCLASTPALLCSCTDNACDNVSGTWNGVCINDTAGGVSAELTLAIKADNDSIIGTLIIKGQQLVGSGKLTGFVNNNVISFQSEGDGKMYNHITWMGTISDNTITGSYRVEPTAEAVLAGVPPQDGRFTVSK